MSDLHIVQPEQGPCARRRSSGTRGRDGGNAVAAMAARTSSLGVMAPAACLLSLFVVYKNAKRTDASLSTAQVHRHTPRARPQPPSRHFYFFSFFVLSEDLLSRKESPCHLVGGRAVPAKSRPLAARPRARQRCMAPRACGSVRCGRPCHVRGPAVAARPCLAWLALLLCRPSDFRLCILFSSFCLSSFFLSLFIYFFFTRLSFFLSFFLLRLFCCTQFRGLSFLTSMTPPALQLPHGHLTGQPPCVRAQPWPATRCGGCSGCCLWPGCWCTAPRGPAQPTAVSRPGAWQPHVK